MLDGLVVLNRLSQNVSEGRFSVLYTKGMDSLKQGIYRHYKGGLYEVVALGINSDTEGQTVIYKSLENGMWFTREIGIFMDDVEWEGKTAKRFFLIEKETDTDDLGGST